MRTSTSSKPWETAHKQGMQEHDRIHQNNPCTPSYNLRVACNGRRLRIYGFTDLPPSLPLLSGTLETRNTESSYRRLQTGLARLHTALLLVSLDCGRCRRVKRCCLSGLTHRRRERQGRVKKPTCLSPPRNAGTRICGTPRGNSQTHAIREGGWLPYARGRMYDTCGRDDGYILCAPETATCPAVALLSLPFSTGAGAQPPPHSPKPEVA